MGSSTDEAERRVREQRALIERKVEDLEHRVGDDLSAAGDRLTHHLGHLPDMFPGGSRLMDEAQEHPYTALAGSLGLGVALGFLSGGDRDDHANRNGHQRDGGSAMGAMGAASGLLGGLGTSMLSPLRPYVEDAARQVIAGFADRQRAAPRGEHNGAGSAGSEDGRAAPSGRDY